MSGIIPPRGYRKEDTEKRLKWLAEKTGSHFNDVSPDEPENLKGIIENHTGFVKIPMAVAGPLLIHGSYINEELYIPLCTLEGTLSMSMTRGLYLTHLSGGIVTRHVKQEISRSPIFIFNDITGPLQFLEWLDTHFDLIKKAADICGFFITKQIYS